jgi:group I intron endonuclease
MNRKGEIYMVTCAVTAKKYIGQAVCQMRCGNTFIDHGTDRRWKKHIYDALSGSKRCRALNSAIVKYGKHNFTVKTIKVCDEHQLNYYETKYIRQYNTVAPDGYNLRAIGGSKGRHCQETIEKIKVAKSGSNNHMYGKHHSDFSKQKISNSNTGKVRSSKQRQNISASKRTFQHQNLPMYVYYAKNRNSEGYIIKYHPKLQVTKKSFTSSKLTMDEKLCAAINYIQSLEV